MIVYTYHAAVIKNEADLYVMTWTYPQTVLLNEKNHLVKQHIQSDFIYFKTNQPKNIYVYVYKYIMIIWKVTLQI